MSSRPIALITARGGSVRIPHKNVRPFCGRPLVAWPTRAACASGLFSRVIISTDDEEIAAAAICEGAERPFVRPPELADEHSTTAVMRTQDCTPAWHDVGLLYWFSVSAFLDSGGRSFVPLQKKALVISPLDAVDIDTETDWAFAECVARHQGFGI